MKRLAVVSTHPIQYNAPVFKLLAGRGNVDIKVFYTWGEQGASGKYDPGFGKEITWDIPLLDGYSFEFLENTSADPGSHKFGGIVNPHIIEQITRYRPDSILVYGWNFHSHLKVLRHFRKKVNVLFRGDSTLLNARHVFKDIVRYIVLRWVYTHIDKALYAGAENKKYYLKFGLKESQLIFAPHAVDNARFKFTEQNAEKAGILRKRLGVEENDILFAFAGKFEDNKNPEMLIAAFLKLEVSGAHLLLVGSGILEDKLRAMASGKKNIHFMGFQNQGSMPVIYQMMDVFILPSRSETWGLAVNEAMAAGKPILVSNRCGCAADLVREGENGFIFNFDSVEDLAEKLSLMTDKAKLSVFGKASWNIIQQYSFEHISKVLESTV